MLAAAAAAVVALWTFLKIRSSSRRSSSVGGNVGGLLAMTMMRCEAICSMVEERVCLSSCPRVLFVSFIALLVDWRTVFFAGQI